MIRTWIVILAKPMTTKKYSLTHNCESERGRVVSSVSVVACSWHTNKSTGELVESIKIHSWLSYMHNSIFIKSAWDYRPRTEQYTANKTYRTKSHSRRLGAVTILHNHEKDMECNPESLSTEFMMKCIEDFKREAKP